MKANEKQILEILSNTSDLVSISELAKKTGYSERYIRNIIKDIFENEERNGYHISYFFRKGIRLTILDPVVFSAYLNQEEQTLASSIILYLLEKNIPVSASELQDQFYLSKTTLEKYIKKARSILYEYNLFLTTERHQGYIIFGRELNKRAYFSRNLKDSKINEKQLSEVNKIVLSVIEKYDYEISDDNIHNLCQHLLISIRRINDKEYSYEPLELKEEYPLQIQMAKEIIFQLNKKYNIEIPEVEIAYLVLHLLTKQSIQENGEISSEIRQLSKKILTTIKEKNHIDLTKQFDMQFNLCLHLQPMLIRLKYGVVQENPLTDDIKRQLPEAYELALSAKQVIQDEKRIFVNDAETGYLALHFALGLDKQKKIKPFKVLIACTSGKGTSRLLAHQLIEEYNLSFESITITSVYKLHELNLAEYSCLLSTVILQEEIPIPYMVLPVTINPIKTENVHTFMNDVMHVTNNQLAVTQDNLCEIDAKNKEEVFRYIVNILPEDINKKEMYQNLINRELLSSTEVGNKCAMPHPLKTDVEKSYLYIIKLKKPIDWDIQKVQLVIFSIWADNESSYLSQKIIDIVSNQGLVSEFLNHFSLDTFNKLVKKS